MFSREKLIVLDADGTTVDAFSAIAAAFDRYGMDIGDLARFQKRRHIFKYLGGIKEFPNNLQKQIGKKRRRQLIGTLTEIYREEALLFGGMGELIEELLHTPFLRVGVVTRNITFEAEETLRRLYRRNGVEVERLDFLVHIDLKADKRDPFRRARETYGVNPANCYACGDERGDYVAAQATGMHPFMVSYGFEDHRRLREKIGVPEELISRTPEELQGRVLNALGID